MKNPFAGCDTTEEVVGQACGAVSMCWENVDAAGVFQSSEAAEFVEQAIIRIRQLQVGPFHVG